MKINLTVNRSEVQMAVPSQTVCIQIQIYILIQRRSGCVLPKSAEATLFFWQVGVIWLQTENLDCVKKSYVARGYKVTL